MNHDLRARIGRILRNREDLTEEQMDLLADVLSDANKHRFTEKTAEPPSRVMVLLVLALVEEIERLKAKIEPR